MAESYGCKVTAIDISQEDIEKAGRLNEHHHVTYEMARAEDLPYENENFDIVFSEAAFSLLQEKEKSVSEYRRVLKKNGYVLINDFMIKNKVEENLRADMSFIPCFAGVETKEEYKKYFIDKGFDLVFESDESKEIIKTAMWISKTYKTSPDGLSELFSGFLSKEKSGNDTGSCQCFFKQAKLGYVQMIFRKGGN